MQKNFAKAVTAGIVGTVAMTFLMIIAPVMGMPEMNIGRMLSSFMGVPLALGWLAHFMIGSGLAVVYVYGFAQKLTGEGWIRGAIYSLIPWLMAQIVVNPMMGAGIFASATPAPFAMVMGSLMGHLVYGAVLGAVYAATQPSRASAALA